MTRSLETTSRIMRAVHNRDTAPEMLLRRALHARGLRYRLHGDVIGKPDLIFTRARVAVFVDGDYWHGNAWRTRGFDSFDAYYGRGDNGPFWIVKIRRNMAWDEHVTGTLDAAGWTVLRLWESDLHGDLDSAVEAVISAVRVGGRAAKRAAG